MTQAAEAPGVALLRDDEVKHALAEHPELVEAGIEAPVMLVAAARDTQEAADLLNVLAMARLLLRDQGAAKEQVRRALLPAGALSLSRGLLDQVRRNAEAQKALADEFGLYSAADVARAYGSKATNSSAQASRLRKAGQILAVSVEGAIRYPGFQFGPDGRVRPVVTGVLGVLADRLSDWETALWFTSSNDWLGGVRPVDILDGSNDDRTAVVEAARRLAEELAE